MIKTDFSHIGLSCKDLEKTESFYSRHFGFKQARSIPIGKTKIVFLRNDKGVYLELFEADKERPLPQEEGDGPHYQAIRHLAFSVKDVDGKLAEMGKDAVVTLGPLTFDDFIKGWKTVWVKDPDGNIVEITQGYKDE
ncbi:MAG TPA: glyoxalase [Elusimicrobia bacterium]|jgi:glyoxylase I family protein|nr:glyoxalase [Elusimicrobiota bacterium]